MPVHKGLIVAALVVVIMTGLFLLNEMYRATMRADAESAAKAARCQQLSDHYVALARNPDAAFPNTPAGRAASHARSSWVAAGCER